MATRNVPFPDKVRDMVLDVITHVRRQEYTPEQLCQLQKIIECKAPCSSASRSGLP